MRFLIIVSAITALSFTYTEYAELEWYYAIPAAFLSVYALIFAILAILIPLVLTNSLPIRFQRPFYEHWKEYIKQTLTSTPQDPFLDVRVTVFIQTKLDPAFELGGIPQAQKELNEFIEKEQTP